MKQTLMTFGCFLFIVGFLQVMFLLNPYISNLTNVKKLLDVKGYQQGNYPENTIVLSITESTFTNTSVNVRDLLTTHQQVTIRYIDDVAQNNWTRTARLLDGGVVALGEISPHASMFVAYSVAVHKTSSYLFYQPLTALSWHRLGYFSVIIVCDSLENWLGDRMYRYVLSYVYQIKDVVIIFLPAPEHNKISVSQASRIFAATFINQLAQRQKFASTFDPYIMTCDADLWVFKENMFPPMDNDKIATLNSGCCGYFMHIESPTRRHPVKMLPMAYIRARMTTWLGFLADNFGNGVINSKSIIGALGAEFGDLVNSTVKRGDNEGWYMDQHLMSIWVYKHQRKYGREALTKLDKPGKRIDRKKWPVNITQELIEQAFDAHLPFYRDGLSWPRILKLLERMYDDHWLQWCILYQKQFKTD